MKPRTTEAPRKSKDFQGEGPNWILVAGGALLSTLSFHLGYKLKQVFDAKHLNNSSDRVKVNRNSADRTKPGSCHLHSNAFCFPQDEERCCNCNSGSRNTAEAKKNCNGPLMPGPESILPLVTVPFPNSKKENGIMWSSSPDRLELPQKPFHQSNSSESPCVSESGSGIFSKWEVVQKLRQQLKKRDDMIMEMQDQMAELQHSLHDQISGSSHLQSLLNTANKDLFDSEREIQRLRKAIADHCLGHINSGERESPAVPMWPSEWKTGCMNGHPEFQILDQFEKVKDREKIEMLKREIGELKELIETKDYLLQRYKEEKSELSMKVSELQQRLDSQPPNIL